MKRVKNGFVALIGLLLVGIGLYLIKAVAEPQNVMKALPYLCVGLGCGMFGHGLGDMIARKAVEKNPDLAKQIEIEKKDERNVMIWNMAKAKGYDMMIYVFAALLLAYALMGVAYTVIIPFVVAYLFVQGYAVYYRVKVEKEQ